MDNIKKESIKLDFGNLCLTENVCKRIEELGFDPEDFQEEVNIHKPLGYCPAVYVGTYHKYNCGSIQGSWVAIDDFIDYGDFMDFCMAIHADESEPEIMFQDYQGFSKELYSESMSRVDFCNIQEYTKLCNIYCRDAVDAYLEMFDKDELEEFEQRFVGYYDYEEFGEEIAKDMGLYDQLDNLGALPYFNFEKYGGDLLLDYKEVDGYVFFKD